jgi:hypothetical protein
VKVIEIVRAHLVAGGFDGLVQPDAECGCLLSDLQPCCDDFARCEPGYKRDDPENPGDWVMSRQREPVGIDSEGGTPE